MEENRITTLHPDSNKKGVNISGEKYAIVREAILETIRQHGIITFNELMEVVNRKLEGNFEGSVNWYVTTVKLDLEARGEIERLPKGSPQRLRIKESS